MLGVAYLGAGSGVLAAGLVAGLAGVGITSGPRWPHAEMTISDARMAPLIRATFIEAV